MYKVIHIKIIEGLLCFGESAVKHEQEDEDSMI